jgi:hypothetical protein
MVSLAHQRCFNHALREAAARCPACGRFFCRECITEHEGRVLCALCLKGAENKPFVARMAWVTRILQLAAGILLAWLFFFWFGLALLSLDSSFHNGSIWKTNWLEPK